MLQEPFTEFLCDLLFNKSLEAFYRLISGQIRKMPFTPFTFL
jgi:hypothetical protein